MNSCIHSGSNDYTDGNTVWYNYVAATAGTILDSTTTADNTNIATQSICPKGWSLPSWEQSKNNTDIPLFNPILGGYYLNGTLYNESTYAYWWATDAVSKAERHDLRYRIVDSVPTLATTYNGRIAGFYIRCVSEEKDVSDLTYMQDMTPIMTTRAAWNLCPK
ncbi:hypothetical protein IKF84_00950 [Candidatus Saccharibacteria bacterium]|nr:hypothetical protein [Candidatus Saccharibacteria bacterium]